MGISGVGWLINFAIYCFLFYIFFVSVFHANIIGAIPAVTLVFFVSVRNIFKKHISKIPLWLKYVIYICYTFILLFLVSMLGQWLYDELIQFELNKIIISLAPVLVKCGITVISMTCNFFMMRFLTEII